MSNSENDSVLAEELLSDWLQSAFAAAFADSDADFSTVRAVATANPEFGDYQCNDAMGWGKRLKIAPREVAQRVLGGTAAHPCLKRLEIAGPGFINMWLADEWLIGCLERMAADGNLGIPAVGKGRTVIFDYSSPNVAKPMHVGHIRSTIIGDALDRLHRVLGYRVLSDNHIGDWGTQFGILIMGYRHFLDRERLEASPVDELERLYVRSYERAREDESWMEQCRHELVKLQSGDEDNLRLWRDFVRMSMEEFDRIYSRLGISFDLVRGESHYRDKLPGILELLSEKGLSSQSEGATVVHLEEEGLPTCIVRKKDGGFNYTTTDLATVFSRVEEFQPDAIVYVTDERQQLHFRQFFAICRRLGHGTDLKHVWFGLMRLPEGVFATREGNVIRLGRLLDEAERRAMEIVEESDSVLDEAGRREVARAIGIGAVKYADLSQNPQTTVTFTWDKALALEGNSAPYLQYACARIASVRGKYAEQFPGKDVEGYPLRFSEGIERALGVRLIRFPEVVLRAARGYNPSLVADYLYELAQAYSSFYQNVPFLKAEEGLRESRVRLCGMVARVLRTGLGLLGIETPDRI